MITSAGFYYYRQLTERLKNCRITILADQFTYIQLLLIKMDVECERPIEFVQFVDGLFFGDKLWPQRFHDTYRRYTVYSVCLDSFGKRFRFRQNAVQINYRLKMNQGFMFHVNFVKQKMPGKFPCVCVCYVDFFQFIFL